MASRLERLPTELRHAIIAVVIWAPAPLPDFTQLPLPNRVRARDGLDVWVEPSPRPPAALSLLLTSRTLHDDVRRLVSSSGSTIPYELDIAFIHECGLFPTWTVCPLPSQTHIPALRVSIRILSAADFDSTRPCRPKPASGSASSEVEDRVAARFPGHKSPFRINRTDPQPPVGACNYYHLLTRFFALGPLGVVIPDSSPGTAPSPTRRRQRYTIDHLLLTTASKPPTLTDRLLALQNHPIAQHPPRLQNRPLPPLPIHP